MKAGKIGAGQVIILLLVSRCFSILNYAPVFEKHYESTAVLYGNLLGALIQLLIILPPLILFSRFPGQNAISVAYDRWKPLGWLFVFLYGLESLAQLAGGVVGFQYFMTNAVYPNSSIYFIVISMMLCCFVCARWGLEGIARASTILFLFLLASVTFISIAGFSRVSLLNLHPILESPLSSIWQAALHSVTRNSELYLLILIYPQIRGSVRTCSFGYIAASFVLLEFLNFILFSVLGSYANTQTFPFYTLASIAETQILQRLDSLHMMAWVFTAFVRTTLFAILSNYCFRSVLPQRTHKWILPISFILCTTAAIWVGGSMELLKQINTTSAIAVILMTGGLPLLLLCITKRKKKEGNKRAKEKHFTVVPDSR